MTSTILLPSGQLIVVPAVHPVEVRVHLLEDISGGQGGEGTPSCLQILSAVKRGMSRWRAMDEWRLTDGLYQADDAPLPDPCHK